LTHAMAACWTRYSLVWCCSIDWHRFAGKNSFTSSACDSSGGSRASTSRRHRRWKSWSDSRSIEGEDKGKRDSARSVTASLFHRSLVPRRLTCTIVSNTFLSPSPPTRSSRACRWSYLVTPPTLRNSHSVRVSTRKVFLEHRRGIDQGGHDSLRAGRWRRQRKKRLGQVICG
jgi:hypothetical protein